MSYTLEIYGRLWSGARAVYSYTLPAPIHTDAEADRAAGDFAHVLDWRLVRRTGTYERRGRCTVNSYETCTVRGFRNGMTPQRFYRLVYGEVA